MNSLLTNEKMNNETMNKLQMVNCKSQIPKGYDVAMADYER